MKNILVTGGAGFIGSNFIRFLLGTYDDVRVVNFDALTYAGNLGNLRDVSDDPRYVFVRGDVCDKTAVDGAFGKYGVDTVVHFAAESHVDRSITNPEVFLSTNVLGTGVLLDAARRHWSLSPGDKYCRDYRPDGLAFSGAPAAPRA